MPYDDAISKHIFFFFSEHSFTSLCSFWEKTEDIDIAIDNMTGSGFLEKFQNYFSRKVGEKVNVHIIKSVEDSSCDLGFNQYSSQA